VEKLDDLQLGEVVQVSSAAEVRVEAGADFNDTNGAAVIVGKTPGLGLSEFKSELL